MKLHLAARVKALVAFGFLAVMIALVFGLMLLAANPAHGATTFTVDSTRDEEDATPRDGVCDSDPRTFVVRCTLRAAIEEANATDGTDTINFNIEGSGPHTIAPSTQRPAITDTVRIDGYSQPGARPNTREVGTSAVLKIELNGASAQYGNGLVIEAPKTLIKGLAINSFDSSTGVFITFPAATGNKVQGNYIGTKRGGTGDLGNIYGVRIEYAPGNLVGGTDAQDGAVDGVVQAGNVISGNDRYGVFIHGTGTFGDATGNRILGNSIFSNTNLGIDLNGDGPTTNDTGDGDTGPNNLQNFPVLTSATTSSDTTTIRGTLNSNPSTTFTVQFFRNPAGTDEGKTFIGQKRNVTTDASGEATFTFRPDEKVNAGLDITATATDPEGNTSEFSDPETVG